MRMLDRAKIPFEAIEYEVDEADLSAYIADSVGLPYDMVFKTLVAKATKPARWYFVFLFTRKLI